MATPPETILLAFSSIILLGFLGQLFFRATRVSDILILMAFGSLLAWAVRATPEIDGSVLPALAPIVGMFALLVILFEGGLDLRFGELMQGLGRSLLLAVLGFGLTVAGIAAAGFYLLGMDWLHGVLLGCILGGSSSIAVMPIVKRLPISENTRVVLSVESAITDILCVVGALTVASILALKEQPDLAGTGQSVLNGFIVAIAIGFVAGLLWLKLLDQRFVEGVRYMLTLAFVLGLHVFVNSVLEANGPVAVLTLGIMLGNAQSLRRMLHLRSEGFTKPLRAFQSEIAFVTRAFFFVYLGFILDPRAFNLPFVRVALVLVAALAVARALAVFAATTGSASMAPDRAVAFSMMPRGLAAAVLASVPALTFGISGTENFVAFTAIVIVLTNVVASVAGLVAPKVRGTPVADGGGEARSLEPAPARAKVVRRRRAPKEPDADA